MNESEKIRIWDPWIRLFHWSLAISIGFLLISGNTGWQFYEWHRQAGEAALALILFRILWGFFGSSNARIKTLFQNPMAAVHHLANLFRRRTHPERGHNAAGSFAVIALLLIIAIQAVSGLFIADEDEFIEGALYNTLSEQGTSLAMKIHRINAELILIVVAVHIVMVFFYLIYAKQNLIQPMITGWMTWTTADSPPPVTFQKFWIGAILFCAATALVGYLVGWFP